MDPMEAIRATFFQECDELLSDLEDGLLKLQAGAGDSDTVNAVFRAVHSVKGGAGAFGLDALVRFAHVFETCLDELRAGRVAASADMIAVLLRAADVLSDHVTAAKGGAAVDETVAGDVMAELRQSSGMADDEAPDAEPDFGFAPLQVSLDPIPLEADAAEPSGAWRIRFTPRAGLYRNANDALRLVRELERFSSLTVTVIDDDLPELEALEVEVPALTFDIEMDDADGLSASQIAEVFEFVEGDCDLEITPPKGAGNTAACTAKETPEDVLARLMSEMNHEQPAVQPPPAASSAPPAPQDTASAAPDAVVQTTIRVDLERVDRLIDLVGELVINQAMLAQRVLEAGLARTGDLAIGLDDLEQLTREIQDSVMAIRAQPVKSVFQRMPRLVREVAAATGKRVRLVTDGEATEVDKTVIERLSDPITHMIRNAIDHGLETPDDRIAAGKTDEGVVRLSAQHRSGRIVIEVADDGRGINRERVKSIAVERGLIAPDATLSDDEIDNLIFAPGFSTASTVSDISGRGVGMDVVKRSVQALGGRISISSRPGAGSTFTLSLPLTLAVLDGMVVTVGQHTLVAPINVIVETLRPRPEDVRALGPTGTVLAVRGSHVPLIDVAAALGWSSPEDSSQPGVTLLVEGELGGLAALRVDAIQGQRQVVIKSLEQNYRQVAGVGAATIMGDGQVALILDVDGLIAARQRPPSPFDPGVTAPPPQPFALAS